MDFYRDESAQAAFFESLAKSYTQAATHFEERIVVSLAGISIELRFATPALRDLLLPALRHLLRVDQQTPPELAISVWDKATTGVPFPSPPFDRKRITDRGDIWGFVSTRFRLAFHYGEFSVNAFDRQNGQGYFWVNDPAKLPYWTSAAPLRSQLHWCMELKERQLLHAAAVGSEDGALLLTGRGGIGKSSTALSALLQGMDYAGDDYVVLELGPQPYVYPLYCSAKVNRDQLAQYQELAPWLRNPCAKEGEKAIFDLLPGFASQIPVKMRLRAVLVPEISGKTESSVTADLGLDEARHAAAFTTIEQLPYAGKYTYRFIDKLTRDVPAYRLKLGTDKVEMVASLKRFLKEPMHPAAKVSSDSLSEMQLPLVSVVIPAYNRENMISEALANVRKQGYPALDVIVVDDGSTDKTAEVVRSHPEVRLFEQPNGGPAQARNRAVINARGHFIAFLDSDDLWPDGMLRFLVDALVKDPEAEVVRGWSQLSRIGVDGEEEFEGNPAEGFPNHITGAVFRREVFSRIGLFDPELRFGEDSDWFNRAREQGVVIKRLDCVSVIVRRHGGNMTHGKNLVQLNVLRVAKKVLDRRRASAKTPPANHPS